MNSPNSILSFKKLAALLGAAGASALLSLPALAQINNPGAGDQGTTNGSQTNPSSGLSSDSPNQLNNTPTNRGLSQGSVQCVPQTSSSMGSSSTYQSSMGSSTSTSGTYSSGQQAGGTVNSGTESASRYNSNVNQFPNESQVGDVGGSLSDQSQLGSTTPPQPTRSYRTDSSSSGNLSSNQGVTSNQGNYSANRSSNQDDENLRAYNTTGDRSSTDYDALRPAGPAGGFASQWVDIQSYKDDNRVASNSTMSMNRAANDNSSYQAQVSGRDPRGEYLAGAPRPVGPTGGQSREWLDAQDNLDNNNSSANAGGSSTYSSGASSQSYSSGGGLSASSCPPGYVRQDQMTPGIQQSAPGQALPNEPAPSQPITPQQTLPEVQQPR